MGSRSRKRSACRRPVVASDWNGYKELIVHGETGFKVRTDWADCLGELNELAPVINEDQAHLHVGQSVRIDVPEMVGYLMQLLENRELREAMGERGRARAEALYAWPTVVRQWEALWGESMAIARSLEVSPEHRLDYLQPHYFEHFFHYASRIVDDATWVRLTERAKEVMARKAPLFLHPWAQGLLQPNAMHQIMNALKVAPWLGRGLPVGELIEALEKPQGLSRERILMHLMWLAKYDLVSLDGGGQPPDRDAAE